MGANVVTFLIFVFNKHTTMNKSTLTIEYTETTPDRIPREDALLLEKAVSACDNAYAPYSHFKVGAAVRLSDGMIVTGNNQENVSFPAGVCAERSALNYAHAKYPEQPVEAIAIAAKNKEILCQKPVSPCGICRQVLLESEKRAGKPIRIILGSKGTVRIFESVKDLLPF
jgi:cytidine deaminase